MNTERYLDCYFKLYHELHNLHSSQRTAAERNRVDYCIELMHDIHRILNESIES